MYNEFINVRHSKLIKISGPLKDKIEFFHATIKHLGLHETREVIEQSYNNYKEEIESQIKLLDEKWITYYKPVQDYKKSLNLLNNSLSQENTINFENLKIQEQFINPDPRSDLQRKINSVSLPLIKETKTYPVEPIQNDYNPKITILDNLLSNKNTKLQKAKDNYLKALEQWKAKCSEIDSENQISLTLNQKAHHDYESNLEKIKNNHEIDFANWEIAKSKFEIDKKTQNDKVETLKIDFNKGEPYAIIEGFKNLLNCSNYPDNFPKSFDLDFVAETHILIVEFVLPNLEDISTTIEIKYHKNELKPINLSNIQRDNFYEQTLYKLTLKIIHEIFSSDKYDFIDAITLNGWVNQINKATGTNVNNCILSLQVNKKAYQEIDLTLVDPKSCFKNLKGISSSKLAGLTPIQPIMQINKKDKRFTNHYDVAQYIDNSTNLAMMDWEDFEHLIREVFEQEFRNNGGEVKITQASRDGGVDAIAFDPDPIKGGKIIIQAKRYTNTVGISAVRDLFGTVMNEGANKGILVTTSDYGPDSYEFIKGKNLTLMNGGNLLYLLEKHGHKARIDIVEARKILKE